MVENDMNSFDSAIALKMARDGYLISPHDTQVLEGRCSENIADWEARWKILGFYHAHQLCCPQFRSRCIENLIWIIENVPEISRGMRFYLLLGPGDRLYIPKVRAAFQRRIDAAPNDPVVYVNMGDFLQAIIPGEACSYYEKALSLSGGTVSIQSSLTTAKLLEKNGADATTEDYGQERMTCFFDVLQAGARLLQETRDRMQPSEADWNRFFDIANPLIWSPMLRTYAQFGDAPVDASASTICKFALRQFYKAIDAKSAEGRALRKPPLKALWKDLVKP